MTLTLSLSPTADAQYQSQSMPSTAGADELAFLDDVSDAELAGAYRASASKAAATSAALERQAATAAKAAAKAALQGTDHRGTGQRKKNPALFSSTAACRTVVRCGTRLHCVCPQVATCSST